MKNLLGGKGANLAEMAGHNKLRLPVPPGFTITTDVCNEYLENRNRWPKGLEEAVKKNLSALEKEMLKTAMRKCRTTREMADFLNISQPSVVRKLKKHNLSQT